MRCWRPLDSIRCRFREHGAEYRARRSARAPRGCAPMDAEAQAQCRREAACAVRQAEVLKERPLLTSATQCQAETLQVLTDASMMFLARGRKRPRAERADFATTLRKRHCGSAAGFAVCLASHSAKVPKRASAAAQPPEGEGRRKDLAGAKRSSGTLTAGRCQADPRALSQTAARAAGRCWRGRGLSAARPLNEPACECTASWMRQLAVSGLLTASLARIRRPGKSTRRRCSETTSFPQTTADPPAPKRV